MTEFLVDTNTLSETNRKQPDPKVQAWFASLPPQRLYLSSISVAEFELGIGLQTDPTRAARLRVWLESVVLSGFAGRILAFDVLAARTYGAWLAAGRKAGRIPPATDAQIAAIAYVHGLTVATRNTADFAGLPVKLFNPWM